MTHDRARWIAVEPEAARSGELPRIRAVREASRVRAVLLDALPGIGTCGFRARQYTACCRIGCIDVVLEFAGQADEPESAMAVGTMTRALVLEPGAWPECFVGVRFRPGKAAAFLTVPANELTDLRVSLDELWLDAGEVRDALSVRAGAVERVRALERVLAARVSPSVVSAQHDVDEAIRRIIDAGGSLGITRLAPALGVTRQHLARRFSELVGVSPKTFARVVRLRRMIERARAVPAGEAINWSALALNVGYYDQAHLVDEFRELTGISPTVWQRG